MEYLKRIFNVIIFLAMWLGVPILLDYHSLIFVIWIPAVLIITYLEEG